jgi:phosphoribosylformylglycinamidine cyclo-ligase
LARAIIGLSDAHERNREILAQPLPGGDGETIGEALLAPHRSFAPIIQPLLDEHPGVIRGMAHITGGGIVDNVPRMLPAGLAAEVDPSRWQVPPIFSHLIEKGNVPPAERYRAFNMGLGFVIAVRPDEAEMVLAALPEAARIGVVRAQAEGEPAVVGLPVGAAELSSDR